MSQYGRRSGGLQECPAVERVLGGTFIDKAAMQRQAGLQGAEQSRNSGRTYIGHRS